jgi:ribulose-phosphate 3-epimerase
VRQMIDDRRPECDLEVEGGIDADSAFLAADAGADVLVAGASVFECEAGVAEGMRRLRDAARRVESRSGTSGSSFRM